MPDFARTRRESLFAVLNKKYDMENIMLLIGLICIILFGCNKKQTMEQTSFLKMEKVMLKEEKSAQFFYWEIDQSKQLWEFELGEVNYLDKYKDSLKMELGDSELEQAIRNEETQNLEAELVQTAENRDRTNALLVHTGILGKIRKINFLEAEILNYQIQRFPLFSHPTEFHGFIATHEKDQRLRVYFASSDTEWPPKPEVIINQLEEDIKNGWKLKYHLHNHYCKKDKNYIGILAPSLADAQYFKMLSERFNLSKALITNGFHTVEIDHSEFVKFESH